MQRHLNCLFFAPLLLLLCCIKTWAQPTQLPSLFDEPTAQNEYQKNSVLKPGDNPEAKIHSLIFIKTSISKKTCFVGEPILVTYQLYTAVSCHSRVTKQVAFSGCSVIEMTSDEPEQTQKDKGVIYRVQLIRKVELIPLQAGDLLIPPATVNNEVSFSTTDNPYREKSYSADVSSEPSTVAVTSLPDNQPDNFSGITGKFSITAKTDSTEMAEGESNRLQVTISGAGNIEAVTEPKINWPKHTEHFDPLDSQHINRLNFPESGDKTFIFPFIVTKKGKTILPQISFTYFDTEVKQFETVTTKEILLVVKKSVAKNNPVALLPNNISNEKYLWFVPAIAVAVVVVWLLINKNQKKAASTKLPLAKDVKDAKQTLINEAAPTKPDYQLLLTALNETEDNKTFFANAKTLLVSALQYQLSPKQDDEMILLNLLNSRDEALAKEAEQIITACNQNLYSPVENEATRSKLIEQLSRLIHELDKV